MQGSRLTTWELARFGIPHALIADGAAAGLISRGEVKVVMVGADRIAANGDVVNKVGTFGLALAAKDAGIPFVVVAPTSTLDLTVASGDKIPIEERAAVEVTSVLGTPVAPPGTYAVNPAFDVTPARLVTAIVTENGTAAAPFAVALKKLARGEPRPKASKAGRSKPVPKRASRPAPKARSLSKAGPAPKARSKPAAPPRKRAAPSAKRAAPSAKRRSGRKK
jgi:methylthioribose-1-phosphate isomerase